MTFTRFLLLFAILTVLVVPMAARTVSAQGAQNSLYLPLVVNVSPPIIQNGGFESGRKIWAETSQPAGIAIILQQTDSRNPPPAPPHSGQWLAWLGGKDNLAQSISQPVFISESAPYLVYWQWIASLDDCGKDKATILVDSAVAYTYDLCRNQQTAGWQFVSFDLSAYVGKVVNLTIATANDGKDNSNLFIDDVSFQSTP